MLPSVNLHTPQVTKDTITLKDGEQIKYGICVWSAGNAARPLVQQLAAQIPEQAPFQPGGRPSKLAVDPFLRWVVGVGVGVARSCRSCSGEMGGAWIAITFLRWVVGVGAVTGPCRRVAGQAEMLRSSDLSTWPGSFAGAPRPCLLCRVVAGRSGPTCQPAHPVKRSTAAVGVRPPPPTPTPPTLSSVV